MNNNSVKINNRNKSMHENQTEIIKIYDDFVVYEGSIPFDQTETIVTTSFTNQDILIGSAMTFCRSEMCEQIYRNTGYYISTDGGLQWNTCSDEIWDGSYYLGDPSPMIDANGNIILTYLEAINGIGDKNLYANFSTNNG